MRNRETEVLAPAGSYECLEAAVQAGADAVYLGGRQFGARAFAANFDREDLLRALEYVHLRGRKLYLTVNTLLKDRETEELVERTLAPKKTKPKTKGLVKDVRLFLNTVNRAIDVMKQSGIRAQTDKRETEQYFEYIVRIPKA